MKNPFFACRRSVEAVQPLVQLLVGWHLPRRPNEEVVDTMRKRWVRIDAVPLNEFQNGERTRQ